MSNQKLAVVAALALTSCSLFASCTAEDKPSEAENPPAAEQQPPAPGRAVARTWSQELLRHQSIDWVPFARSYPQGFPQAAESSADVVSGKLDRFLGFAGIELAPEDVETFVVAQILVDRSLSGVDQPAVNVALPASQMLDVDRLNELLANGSREVVAFLSPIVVPEGGRLVDWDSDQGQLFWPSGGFLLFGVSEDGTRVTTPLYPEAKFPVDVQKALADLGFELPAGSSGKGG